MTVRPTVRLIVPTVAMSIVLLLLGGVAAWYLDRLQRESSQLLEVSVEKVEAAEELAIISRELRYELRQYVTANEDHALVTITNLREQAGGSISRARALASSERETALIDLIDQGYEHVYGEFGRIRQGAIAPQQGPSAFGPLHDMAATQIIEPVHELRSLNRQLREDASQHNHVVADRMGAGLLLLGSCGAVAGLLTGYGIARGVHRSIAQLTIPVRDAAGRLNEVVGPITVSSAETLQELESVLHGMADRVATVVSRLQESQLAASRAQQLAAVGQLAAGLAHELRNPLTAMKMLVQPIGDQESIGALDAEDVTVVRQEIDRLEKTIQVFLDYARPPKLEKRPVVLRQLLGETVNLVAYRAQQKGIRIQSEFPDQVVDVEADAGQMRQVLLNLLLNAVDASPEGETVSVRMRSGSPGFANGRAHSTSEDSGWVTIEVADRGGGLSAELGQRVFEPFVSTKDGGTGLGLPICKRIVKDHGGEIRAGNREGGGAVFAVALPVTCRNRVSVPPKNAATGAALP